MLEKMVANMQQKNIALDVKKSAPRNHACIMKKFFLNAL